MHMNDGRVVSNFVLQALQNESITVEFDYDDRVDDENEFCCRFMEMVNTPDHSNMLVIWSRVLLL